MPPKKRKAPKKTAEEKEEEKKARAEAKAKKEAERAEARARKEAEKARKKAEEEAREEAELHNRANRVVSVLKSVDEREEGKEGKGMKQKDAIFKGQDDGLTSSHAAPRALFNAVECQDLERAKQIIKSYRRVLDSEGNRVTDEDKIRKMEEDLSSGLEDLQWKLPFTCPTSKSEGADVNALSVALRNGQLEMLDLLLPYFGWTPILGNEESTTTYRGQTFSQSAGSLQKLVIDVAGLPGESFDKLLEREMFEVCLPDLAMSAMRYGRITFVRRVLRFYLGVDYMDLNVSWNSEKKESGEALGVTMLHLAALESKSADELSGLVVDETTTNAAALGKFVTPMHLAALSGNLEVYQALEKAGGDWTIQTNDGLFPISYAAASPPPSVAAAAAGEEKAKKKKEEERKAKEVEEPKKKRRKKDPDQEEEKEEEEEEDPDSPIGQFQRAVRPSATFRYMTLGENLGEELRYEYNYNIGSKRCILEAAILAGRHHNIAWLIHWFDESESVKWYQYNGEMPVLQDVIAYGDAEMLSLFLANPRFQSIFRSEGTDLISSVIDKSHVEMLHLILEEWEGMDEKDKVTLECTPVHLQAAIRHESLPMIRALLKEGKVDVNSPEVPISALHVACEVDFVECALLLLENGANARAETSDCGVSVMQHACRCASIASIKLLLDNGISLDLKKEVEIKMKQDEEEKAKRGGDDEPEDMETEETSPFEGWFMVLTGIFSVSKEVIKGVIESQGGKVQPQVNGKTTHCVYSGRDGYNDYGQKMGKGDKKYTAAKKKRLPFLDENDILRYLKRTGQAIASHETSGNLSTGPEGSKGHDEASFLHDVIKNCSDKSHVPSVQTLLDHGADRTILDDFGRSPLHYAVMHLSQTDSNIEMLSALQGPEKKILVNQYDKTGMTPLLQACVSGKWEFTKVLLEVVEDVNLFAQEPQKEEKGEKDVKMEDATVKKEAGNKESSAIKKEEEEEEENTAPKPPKFQNTYSGWSLGHLLLVNGMVDLFKRFVELGGDVNTRMRTPDETPLVVASVSNPDICRVLLTNPKCDVNATNAKGQSLLHAIFVRLTVGRVLRPVERNDFNTRGIQIPSTRTVCPPSGEVSIIHLTNFWRWNPDLDASIVDSEGNGVFHAACSSEDTTSCIRAFLGKGDAKTLLHQMDGLGNSPLARALLNRKLHVVLFLMDQGADINGHVYWRRTKEEEESDQKSNETSPHRRRHRRQQHHSHNLTNEDGEFVDEERMRVSIYTYVMRMDMSADIIYNILRLPSCDMSAALRASISTGNLKWTEQLIRSVDVKTPEDAGKFVRLLFSSTANPNQRKQEKMLELSERLVDNAGGIVLDVKESTGFNVVHTMVGEHRINTNIVIDVLKLIGSEKSIQALMATEKIDGQTALHMAVIDNRIDVAKSLLLYVKEYGKPDDLAGLLDKKDSHAKTALHYAVGANSEGTYLNGALLSLLVRFGSKITIPDGDGKTVAMVVGQMPRNHLDHFKRALAGREEGGRDTDGQAVELPEEALGQIEEAQAQRDADIAERTKKEKNERKEYAKQWKSLQKQWEEFRTKRLEAKSAIFEETRQKAKAGGLIIPLDQACPDSHAYQVHVGAEGDVYDALLVSSDLRYNFFGSNSFHALQLVELTEAYKKERVGRAAALANAQRNEAMLAYRLGMAKYRVVERWGRIGDWDTKSRANGFTQLSKAVKYFETVFLDKTKNAFPERENFEAARGAYNWVQKVYDDAAVDDDNTADAGLKSDGTLHKSVETFFRAITSLTRVRQELRDNGFGVDGLPLGQLSPNTISEAYKILMEAEGFIAELEDIGKLRGRALRENKKESYKIQGKLKDLSNKFYMTIPHDFGSVSSGRFKKPDVINDRNVLGRCLQMLLSLEDVENSINLLLSVSPKAGMRQRLNDIHQLVGCNFRVVSSETDEFKLVQQYASVGGGSDVKIAHLLQVTRYEDAIRFVDHESDRGVNDRFGQPKNRLLWHGSRMSNILGIMMKGLKIAPPEAPVAGYNFGKGLYLADNFAKSASYSSSRRGYRYQHGKKSTTDDVDHYRVMLLCEAALGEPCKLRHTNPKLTEPPEGYDSVQCVGRTAPSSDGMFLTKDGVGVPLGQVENVKGTTSTMHHNEFIVYDESRVRIKYVMLFE